jgi:hypothetical protein
MPGRFMIYRFRGGPIDPYEATIQELREGLEYEEYRAEKSRMMARADPSARGVPTRRGARRALCRWIRTLIEFHDSAEDTDGS